MSSCVSDSDYLAAVTDAVVAYVQYVASLDVGDGHEYDVLMAALHRLCDVTGVQLYDEYGELIERSTQ